MKHYYKINDPFEIRIIILYTLLKAQRALTPYEISHIILSSAEIDFFEIHDALSFLTDANEIYLFKSMDEKTLYALTPSGKNGADSFLSQIPLEVREYIDQCIEEIFEEQKKQSTIVAKSIPVNFDEYEAHLEIRNQNINLMSLNIYAKDENLSKKMCKNFHAQSSKIYDTIISMLMEDLDDTKEENM